MNQTLSHMSNTPDLKDLSLLAWRIRRTRAKIHENQVHRQIMEQLHEGSPVN